MSAAEACAPQVVETHSAVVVLLGELAYKVKKPVDLGFLDFSTREAREAVCHREVELNRRLSPDVYLGVWDLVGPDGRPTEHVVVMRRMPAERALSRLVQQGQDVRDDLRRLARLVAAFHSTARTSPEIARAGSPEALQALWDTGLTQLVGTGGLDPAKVERLRHLATRYLAGRGPLLAERQREGRVRDGHGDLLAADVYCLPDGPRVLDCIEFDDALRHGDVLLDVAFLAMDLEDLGRPDLGRVFLDDYEEFSGQSQPVSLARHYVAYRAQVRSKVTFLRWQQGDDAARAHGTALADLALRHLERAAVRLVLVGGLPGTGKSTVAAGLADARGWALVRSDVLRKQLAGLPPAATAASSYGTGLYTAERTQQVYDALLDRARTALGRGESVVLDATWSSQAQRDAACRVAEQTSSELVELCCSAPLGVTAVRMRRRTASGQDASDADAATARAMADRFDSWPTAVLLTTDRERREVLADAQRSAGP